MHIKKHIFCSLMIVLITAFDRVTKHFASAYLKGKPGVTVIKKILRFRYAENTGMAFSAFEGARWFFVALTAAVCAVCLFYMFSNRCKSLWAYWSLGVIVAGGLGNMIDRIKYGFVVDFIEPIFVNYAVFNIADCAVTLGAASLILCLIFDKKSTEKDKKNDGV